MKSTVKKNDTDWHYYSIESVCETLKTSCGTGLTTEDAKQRLHQHGANVIRGKKHWLPFWFRLLLSHTFTIINLILVVAAVLAGAVKEWVDFGVILFVVGTNIIIGFLQEYRSEQTMKSLQKMTTLTCTVLRDGLVKQMDASDLVPGDIVLIKEGDSVPADLRLVEVSDIQCNEALLTGETVPVEKSAEIMSQQRRTVSVPKINDDNAATTTDKATPAILNEDEVLDLQLVSMAAAADSDQLPQVNQDDGDDVNTLVASSLPLGDRINCAFMGTTVTKGKARGIVTVTGMDTEIGKIAKSVSEKKQKSTPLQRRMTILSLVLVVVAVIAIGIVLICTWRYDGKNKVFPDAVIIGISIAVAVIPECMVAVVTLTMTVGMRRMAQENVIVRKLAALENLGHVHDICTDKTGTLTEGKMVVTTVWTDNKEYTVTSVDGSPIQGALMYSGKEVELNPSMQRLVTVAALCNTSSLVGHLEPQDQNNINSSHHDGNQHAVDIELNDGGQLTKCTSWTATGDPTEIALNAFSQKMQLSKDKLESETHLKHCEFPFDSTVKRMSVVYREQATINSSEMDEEGRYIVLTKGAPERIVDLCSHILVGPEDLELEMMDASFKSQIKLQNETMATKGLRVISVAYKWLAHSDLQDLSPNSREAVESNLVFVGLIGIEDPPRAEVPDAIKTCHEAGIVVHMVTGDHPATARSIAHQVGIVSDADLNNPEIVMEATQFDNLSDDELKMMKRLPLVIARCSPQSKVKMIKALHDRKHLVAMTGDGVNDAPAISDADVGIAMGKAGSDVTKEASDMILTDDNFSSIVSAIRQGRRISNNIRKFVIHLLSAIVALQLSLLIPVVAKSPIPMNATHILWVNLVTTAPIAIGLGVEQPATDIMQKDGFTIGESVFDPETVLDILFMGVLNGLVTLINYFCMTKWWLARDLMSARSVAFTTMVIVLLFRGYSCRGRRRMLWEDEVWKSYFLHVALLIGVVIQVCVVYIPTVNTKIFHHNPLKGDEWAFVITALIVFMVGTELYKLFKMFIAFLIRPLVRFRSRRQKKKTRAQV